MQPTPISLTDPSFHSRRTPVSLHLRFQWTFHVVRISGAPGLVTVCGSESETEAHGSLRRPVSCELSDRGAEGIPPQRSNPASPMPQHDSPKECVIGLCNLPMRFSSSFNPFPTPEISSRAQSTPCTLRPATAPRPLGLGGRPRAHPDRTRARYNRTRVGEV